MTVLTLEDLLIILRQRGLSIGIREHANLQTLLETQPSVDNKALYELFCVVLAKNASERETIRRVFNVYLPEEPQALTSTSSPTDQLLNHETKPQPSSEDIQAENEEPELSFWQKQKEHLKKWWPYILGLIVFLIALFFVLEGKTAPSPAADQIIKNSQEDDKHHHTIKEALENEQKANPLKLIKEVEVWSVDSITIISRDKHQELIIPLLLFTSTGLVFFWLLAQVWQKTRHLKPPRLRLDAKSRTSLASPKDPLPDTFFNTQQRFKITWGSSYYISDEQDNSLDLDETVRQSAAQGIPQLCFNPIRREREVWLWRDNLANNQQQHPLLLEIEQILSQLNIPIIQGSFNHLPYAISDETGTVKRSIYNAIPTQQPLLLICLDSDSVNNACFNNPKEASDTLQQLRQWQHLALIDCSDQQSDLKNTLATHELSCIKPSQVPDWFASQGHAVKLNPLLCHSDEITRWAAACALYPYAIERQEIMALHHALGLDCTWKYAHLSRYGQKGLQGYNFWSFARDKHGSHTPIFLLNHLSETDRERAIDYWSKHLSTLDQYNKQHTPKWRDSKQRYQYILLPQALLQLWNKAALPEAIETLLVPMQGKNKLLQREVRGLLGCYVCEGLPHSQPDTDYIKLPYTWDELDLKSQQALLNLGLGGMEQRKIYLSTDYSSTLLLGSLFGFMCFGAYCVHDTWEDKAPRFTTALDSAAPKQSIQQFHNQQPYIGTARATLFTQATDIKANQTVAIKWKREVEYAQEQLDKDSQLWRLGTARVPLKRNNHIAVSMVVMAEKPSQEAQTLAANLLDSGSADQILISPNWKQHLEDFKAWNKLPAFAMSTQQTQWIYIGKQPFTPHYKITNFARYQGTAKSLLNKLNQIPQGNIDSLTTLGFKSIRGQPYLYINSPIALFNGTKLLPIPTGSFEMGSNTGDDDEKPVHTVSIKQPFWMAETETTFAQYDAYIAATNATKPKSPNWGREKNHPVVNVNWNDAQGYVQWLTDNNQQGLICRLPSEAEWEYAARAGTNTPYPWGNEPGKNKANCEGCSSQWDDKQTAPVGSFQPNAWGLYDMSGNVLEWVQDKWHDNYEGAPTDGSAWETGDSEDFVLRGGSWSYASYSVRSSARYVYLGSNRKAISGFRVVCSPR